MNNNSNCVKSEESNNHELLRPLTVKINVQFHDINTVVFT